MHKSIEYFMKQIPLEMVKEIFAFIIPNKDNIEFQDHYPNFYDTNYGYKYQIACIHDLILFEEGRMLSRIPKKNGKHRYYITTQMTKLECDNCGKDTTRNCCVYYGGDNVTIMNTYTSKYSGKNLELALLELFSKE